MKSKFVAMAIFVLLVLFSIVTVYITPTSTYDLNNSRVQEHFQLTDTLSSELMIEEFSYVVEKILEVHPDPKRNIGQENWDQLIVETRAKLAKPLSIIDYFVITQSFVRKIGDAHTYIFPLTLQSRVLPIEFTWVNNELIVTESQVESISRGDQITRIGNKEVQQLVEFMARIIPSENEYWMKYLSSRYLRQELFLTEQSKDNHVPVTIKTMDGDVKDTQLEWLDNEEVNQSSANEEVWYGYDLDPENNVGYYYLNESIVTTEYEQNVSQFFREVDELQLENIIIDVSSNGGGDSRVADIFLRHLPNRTYRSYGVLTKYSVSASEQRGYAQVDGYEEHPPSVVANSQLTPTYFGNVYVLVGNGTFSSATMFATLFHDSNLASIIGEPTGGAPSGFGDILQFQLPYTGFYLLISHKEFLRPDPSFGKKQSLYPDIVVEMKRADLLRLDDSQLKRVLDYINH